MSHYPLDENFTLKLYDFGVSTPAPHASSHAAAGSDPLTLSSSQITGLGTMASQGAGAVAITGGSIAGVTFSSSNVTITGGAISGVSLVSNNVVLTGGTMNGVVIGEVTPASATFTDLEAGGTVTLGDVTISGTLSLISALPVASGGTGATTAANARTALGLNSMATQGAGAVAITGGTISGVSISAANCTFTGTTNMSGSLVMNGSVSSTTLTVSGAASADSLVLGTDLAVTHGGTGASTAADARTNLGLVIGTNVQAYDADLAAIAALVSSANMFPYATGAGTWALSAVTSFMRDLMNTSDLQTFLSQLGVEIATFGLTAGEYEASDVDITSNTKIFITPTSASANAGHVHVTLDPGVGWSAISSDALDDRTFFMIIFYFP